MKASTTGNDGNNKLPRRDEQNPSRAAMTARTTSSRSWPVEEQCTADRPDWHAAWIGRLSAAPGWLVASVPLSVAPRAPRPGPRRPAGLIRTGRHRALPSEGRRRRAPPRGPLRLHRVPLRRNVRRPPDRLSRDPPSEAFWQGRAPHADPPPPRQRHPHADGRPGPFCPEYRWPRRLAGPLASSTSRGSSTLATGSSRSTAPSKEPGSELSR